MFGSVFNHSLCARTCHKVSKPNGGQRDDNKVEGFKCRPSLNVFEDGSWKSHKQHAAKQHKQQGGDDADLCLRDGPLLRYRDVERSDGGRKPLRRHSKSSASMYHVSVVHVSTQRQQKYVITSTVSVKKHDFMTKITFKNNISESKSLNQELDKFFFSFGLASFSRTAG